MIVKPMRLGVLRQVSSVSGGNQLWITVLGAFDMTASDDFLTEAQLWQTVAPALGATLLDAGMPKTCTEVLVAGDVCAPEGRTARSLVVHLELGPMRKRLAAFGQRWWRHGPDGPVMTRPERFERIPLGWHNAFGGDGHAENPIGKGANARAAINRGEPVELPMIEAPDALVTDIEHRPVPAGFGPRAVDAPSRLRFAGTYDDAWLRDGFPGPGRGLDPRYHNTACPDQQTDEELRGDEQFRLTSMHPRHTDLRGHLPGFRVRAFARQGEAFRELPIRCDTVWLFPNALMGIVLCRGGLAVADKEASDVAHVLLAYERLEEARRAPAHYRTALEERTDPETAALKLLDERPLKPELLPAAVEAVEEERRALGEELNRRREQAREAAVSNALGMAGLPAPPAGLFGDDSPLDVEIPVVTPGEIERLEVDLAGLKARVDALADRVEKEGEAQLAKVGDKLARSLPEAVRGADPRVRSLIDERLSRASTKLGNSLALPAVSAPEVPDAGVGAANPGLDQLFDRAGRALNGAAGPGASAWEQSSAGVSPALRRARNRALGRVDEDDPLARARELLATQAEAVPSGPRSGGASAASAAGAGNLFDAALQAIEVSQVATETAGHGTAGKLHSTPSDPRVGYFNEIARHAATAHASSDADARPEAGLADAQNRLDEAIERLKRLNADGRRASLEPMAPDEPLSEQDSTSLGALALDLAHGTDGLKGRDLAGADLRGADLSGMDLEGIFLERAKLAGVNLARAKLSTAVLTGADLTGADLTGADLTDSNLCGATLARVVLRDACLDRAQLFRSRLDGADLSGASLTEVSLIDASLVDARLAGAFMEDVQFLKCDMSRIALDGARLNKVMVVESETAGFRAPTARFERCALIGIRGEDADLTGAEFVRSACIGNAKLGRARMQGVVSRQSGWRGADLSGADLTAARFDENDLGEAILTGACLHRASLKRAVLHKADARGANFYGANLLEAQAQQVDFSHASLHRANLYSTDLTDARLAQCDLTGTNLVLTLMTKPANAE